MLTIDFISVNLAILSQSGRCDFVSPLARVKAVFVAAAVLTCG